MILGFDPDVMKGAVAGAVTSIFLLAQLTGRAALACLVAGTTAGTLLGPGLIKVLTVAGFPEGPYAHAAAGFLVGVSGLEVCRKIPGWLAGRFAPKSPPEPPSGGNA